jgi:hypothetical protein
MKSHAKLMACLIAAFTLGLVACQSGRTEPDFRPRNPPPAPQHTPRALDHGGHVGMRMSDEAEGEETEKLRGEAEAAEAASGTRPPSRTRQSV